MTRDMTLKQVAAAIGYHPRTVAKWAKEGGLPCSADRRRYSEAEVRAWCAGQAKRVDPPAPVSEHPVDAGEARAPGASRTLDARAADLVRKVTAAKKNQREYDAERGLKGLGLDEKIRAVKTHDDLLTYTKEVMALIGSGDMIPERGRVLRSLVAEASRTLRAVRESEGGGEPERIHLATPEGVALLEDFEWIVSDERRAAIRAFARGEREADEEEFDTFDLAANLPPDAEGDDPMPEEDAA